MRKTELKRSHVNAQHGAAQGDLSTRYGFKHETKWQNTQTPLTHTHGGQMKTRDLYFCRHAQASSSCSLRGFLEASVVTLMPFLIKRMF